jgi:hypothetical protein
MSELLKAIEKTVAEMRAPVEKPYQWVMVPGVKEPRAKCREHGKIMRWAMKISKDYPVTVSKHTGEGKRWRIPVEYQGMLLQVWKCPEEGCEVEAVK